MPAINTALLTANSILNRAVAQNTSSTVSAGAIVAIVIGSLFSLLMLAGLGYWFYVTRYLYG